MPITVPRLLRGLAFFEGGHLMLSVVLDPEQPDITAFYRDTLDDLNHRTEGLVLQSMSLSDEGRKVYFWQAARGVILTWETGRPSSGVFIREEHKLRPI